MGLLKGNNRLFGEIISDVKSQTNVNLLTLEPVLEKLYKSRASRVFNVSLSYASEFGLYLIGLCIIVFSFLMNTIFPFHVLGDIKGSRLVLEELGRSDAGVFIIAVKALAIIIGILIIILGLTVRSNRKFKETIQMAGVDLKLIEENLKRNSEDLDLIEYHDLGQEEGNSEN